MEKESSLISSGKTYEYPPISFGVVTTANLPENRVCSGLSLSPKGEHAVVTSGFELFIFNITHPLDDPLRFTRDRSTSIWNRQTQLTGQATVAWNPHLARESFIATTVRYCIFFGQRIEFVGR
jgi:hypothetical protein